jgi:hypothetical protein
MYIEPNQARRWIQIMPHADSPAKHEFLATLLKDTRYGLVDFMFKQAAIVLLFLGWIVSSDKAQEYISHSILVKLCGVLLVVAYSGMFVVWALTYWTRSNRAYEQLIELDYMPASYYSSLRIGARTIIGFILLHGAACIIAIVLIVAMERR